MRAGFFSRRDFSRGRGSAAAGVGAVLVFLLSACGGGGGQAKPAPAPREQPRAMFEPFAKEAPEVMNTAPKAAGKGESPGAWSIVIVAASGEQAAELGAAALEKVRTVGGLPQAYTEVRGSSVVVAYGRYSGPDDPAAGRDLERIHGIEVDGKKPFIGAVMVPPPFEALEGSIPEYNLSNVRKQRGKDALYTLQIAMYTRLNTNNPKPEELAEFRKSAEQAVNNLRREGEEAFYYHGPRGSMVTVGVFGPKDLDVTKPGVESFALSETRRKYPFNLVNGAQLLVRTKNRPEKMAQPSFVVPIPE